MLVAQLVSDSVANFNSARVVNDTGLSSVKPEASTPLLLLEEAILRLSQKPRSLHKQVDLCGLASLWQCLIGGCSWVGLNAYPTVSLLHIERVRGK